MISRRPQPAPTPRRWIFRLSALVIGVLVVPCLELGLRASGAMEVPLPELDGAALEATAARGQADTPLLQPVTLPDGQPGLQTSPREVREGRMQDVRFPRTPAPGVLRVFCYGGSATLGVPVEHLPERTFPGRLAAHLKALGVTAEVINLGGASFGSRHVRQLVEETAETGPAVHVVYAGNNEYFNYNLDLYRSHLGWYRAAGALEDLHTVRLLRGWLGRPAPEPSAAAAADQRTVVHAVLQARMDAAGADAAPTAGAAGQPPRRRDAAAQAVKHAYQDHITGIVNTLEASPAPGLILLSKVPPNLFHPPWLSLYSPGADPVTTARHRRAIQAAEAAGECAAAGPHLDEAIALEPGHAFAWYRRGVCRAEAGHPDAGADLTTALELDMDPGRPTAALHDVIDATVSSTSAVAIDLEPMFGAEQGWGQSWFHDACHLTPAGQDRLARLVASQLVVALVGRPDLIRPALSPP